MITGQKIQSSSHLSPNAESLIMESKCLDVYIGTNERLDFGIILSSISIAIFQGSDILKSKPIFWRSRRYLSTIAELQARAN